MKIKDFFIKFKKDELELHIPSVDFPIGVFLVLIISASVSIISYIIFLKLDIVMAYNDARAHMDMARLVYDNLNPGIAQIGSVWLPLDHILKLVFVWNDTMWHSGFAGSIWSMLAFVGASIIIFLLSKKATKDNVAAFLGTLLFITNLNVIYMQSTPMTELLLLFFFTATTYFLYLWAFNRKNEYLILAAFWVFLATLTRYDGWFLFVMCTFTVLAITFEDTLKEKGLSFKERVKKYRGLFEGRIILFCTLGFFGIILWLLWNLLIFGDAFYFAVGPYSAKAQQDKIAASGSLFSKHNPYLSVFTYWHAMVDNIGFIVMLFAIVGLVVYLYRNKLKATSLAALTLLSPFLFHVIALIVGFSILVVPEVGPELTKQASSSWFNVRYGLMIIPAVAFFASYLVKKNALLKIILLIIIILQFSLFYTSKNIITITDGVIGTSSLDVSDVRDWLMTNAKPKQGLILTSISYNNALAFSTGMPLKRFIHEGTGDYWTESLEDPATNARWIVMANGDVGDPVYEALVKKHSSNFLHFYDLKLKAKHTNVYERKVVRPRFVWRDGSDFRIDEKPFKFVGVNSYDLAYRSPSEIDETLRTAKENGISVVRFWAFGDGTADGFQPKPGEYNQNMINQLNLVVRTAEKYDIKLIVTLSNYWKDYGGIPQYLKWEGLPAKNPGDFDAFYTNNSTKEDYRNYIKKIVTTVEPSSGKALKDNPTIMAWELMNEPRSSTVGKSKLVLDWVSEMSNYLESIDTSHIVAPGTEGFSRLYNDGKNGPSISEISSIGNIDLTTAHYYLGDNGRDAESILADWTKQVKMENKNPFILEEVGFHKDAEENGGKTREDLVKEILELAKKNNINGVMFWNWALKTDDSYGISPLDPKDKALLKIIKNYSGSL